MNATDPMALLGNLIFATPQWGHLAWPILAITVLLLWLRLRRRRSTASLVAARLTQQLVDAPSERRYLARAVLIAVCALSVTVALMRPQLGYEVVNQSRVGAAIMICLDVSRSMLARDATPNRLERAKAEIRDLLGLLHGDQVGLIAFAGRASVMSPLTPDFSFLRLALDDAVPSSISVGGTRLAEPIRKAVEGFASTTEVSRSIILITDGEDHDDFAKEAAKFAAERGVRILAIGFGDENGASITIKDPRSGAIIELKDAQGTTVISKLNAPLLRELALLTDGAYIPAGTGSLDLKAIYQQHIEPLTRADLSSAKRIVRQEMYQWALMLALLALFGALLTTRHRAQHCAVALALVGGLLASSVAQNVQAQTANSVPQSTPGASTLQVNSTSAANSGSTAQDPSNAKNATQSSAAAAPEIDIPADARDAFNAGLSALNTAQLDAAEKLFDAALNRAGTDELTRYSATFNLAWVAVKRAEQQLEAEPQAALSALQLAAERWRQALALRPQDPASQANLAVITQQAMELADKLAARGDKSLEQLLSAAIGAEREAVADVRALVDPPASTQQKSIPGRHQNVMLLNIADQLSSVMERGIVDTQQARATAANQAPGGQSSAAPGPAPQAGHNMSGDPTQANSVAQLERMLALLEQAQQRHTQARHQLRKRQFERAFRRLSLALDTLQRAREQTLPLAARLRTLVQEQTAFARVTTNVANLHIQLATANRPKWLSDPYLEQTQTGFAERTADLAALAEAKLALPHLETAQEALQKAAIELRGTNARAASNAQVIGIEALRRAEEVFMQMRELIALTYTREQQVEAALVGLDDDTRDESWSSLKDTQDDNIERMLRLGKMISEASVKALQTERDQQAAAAKQPASTSAPASGPGPSSAQPASAGPASAAGNSAKPAADPRAAAAERQRLEQAYKLWTAARDGMYDALDALSTASSSANATAAAESVAASVEQLNALRQLFFNVVEHLRELSQQQGQLNERTSEQSVELSAVAVGKVLAEQQTGLVQRATQISKTLTQHASAAARQAPAGNSAPTPTQQPSPEAFTDAAKLVDQASTEMGTAEQGLRAEPIAWAGAQASQGQALELLQAALKRLQPPNQDDEQQQQDSEQQQQQQQDSGEEQNQRDATQNDASGLLQGVRDREAARREERRNQRQRYAPVEKNW